MKNAEIARQFIEANPTIVNNRTIAKLLVERYPDRFANIETARDSVRYVMGKRGDYHSHSYTQEFKNKIIALRKEIISMEYEKPDISPYKINEHKSALVISDLHIPHVDMDALDEALTYGYNKGVTCVIINGDFLDFTTISRWPHIPTEMKVVDAIEMGNKILDYIQSILKCKIYFHAGNHDTRFESFISQRCPELWKVKGLSLREQLNLSERKIEYIGDLRYMQFGKLCIAHGHHVVKGIFAPVNAARGAFNKAGVNILISHVHRTSAHIEQNMKGEVIGSWSIGCLTHVKPVYNPQTGKFNQGFAVVELIDKHGDFIVDNKQIINGKVR